MKAIAVFPHTKEVKVIEHEAPRMTEPDHVKVRMLEIGICGTDKEICTFEYGMPPQDSDYLVIGHESLGEVIEVGPAVSNVKVGDLVVLTVRRPCSHPECRPCRSGYPDFCTTGDYTERGIKGAHGFMTEEVVDHERYLHVVPPEGISRVRMESSNNSNNSVALLFCRRCGAQKYISLRIPWGIP